MIGTIIVVVLIVGVIAYGILAQTVLKDRQPVAVVNGKNITSKTFQNLARYNRYSLIRNAQQTAQFMQMFGSDPSTQGSFISQLQQIKAQIEPNNVGQSTLDELVDNELIREEAAKRGITVTSQDVDKALGEALGYYPGGSPTPSPTVEPLPTSTLSPLQITLIPPTATLSPTVTAVSPTIETPTPSATPILTPTATPTPYTEDGYKKVKTETLDDLMKTYGVDEATIRFVIESALYRDRLMEVITKDLPHTQDEVWARHILVKDEQQAKDILAKLSAGEDWTKLAAEFSTDSSNKDNGGDLGWFERGRMVPEFENVVFGLAVGEVVSQPVKTNFGYHIIQSLGHEERPIDSRTYQQKRQLSFQDWLKKAQEGAQIDKKDIWINLVPTQPAFPAEIENLILQASQFQPTQEVPIPSTPAP
jgi:parvulin-like peptidyl-prolyl isomerase